MRVSQLKVKNIRNISNCELDLDPKINLFIGKNGQGKTSFLECLSLLSTLRSFRKSKIEELIQKGKTESYTLCKIKDGEKGDSSWETELKVSFFISENEKVSKAASINQKPFKSSTRYLKQRFGSYELGFHCIVFNPRDHYLVDDEPAQRRSYLDQVLSAEDETYLDLVRKYGRILQQKNAALKSIENPSRALILGFTEALCSQGCKITLERFGWVQRLQKELSKIMYKIAPDSPLLGVKYISNLKWECYNFQNNFNNLKADHFSGQEPPPSLELLEKAYWKQYSLLERNEYRLKTSLVGPHRDDWSLFLGENVLKGYGSQGEVRSALLALKLSELGLFREKTNHRPVFLLDDFSSELDRQRREFLLSYLLDTDLQVFITSTEDLFKKGKKFFISEGTYLKGTYDDRTNQPECE